jgi:hypothetical protein
MGKKRRNPEEEEPLEATKSERARQRARNMVDIPDDLYEQLRQEAEANERPVAWQLRVILREHFLRKSGQRPPP